MASVSSILPEALEALRCSRLLLHLVEGQGEVLGQELSGGLATLLGGAEDEAGGGGDDLEAELRDLVLVQATLTRLTGRK